MLNHPPPQSKPLSLIQKLSSLFLTALFLLGSATQASAAVLKLNADNKLIGVEGLEVTIRTALGTITNTYNLDFVFDTFTNIYGTRTNRLRAFDFVGNEATAIATALQNSVLIDSSLGNFDTDLTLTANCPAADGVCAFRLPVAFLPINNTLSTGSTFFNRVSAADGTSSPNDSISNPVVAITLPGLFVVPSPVAAVPEASTYAMMGLGLVMLAGVARRRKTLA